jgi:hypothetical protein
MEQCAIICATSIFPHCSGDAGCSVSMRETISSNSPPLKQVLHSFLPAPVEVEAIAATVHQPVGRKHFLIV